MGTLSRNVRARPGLLLKVAFALALVAAAMLAHSYLVS
jgi:hypothetical protein